MNVERTWSAAIWDPLPAIRGSDSSIGYEWHGSHTRSPFLSFFPAMPSYPSLPSYIHSSSFSLLIRPSSSSLASSLPFFSSPITTHSRPFIAPSRFLFLLCYCYSLSLVDNSRCIQKWISHFLLLLVLMTRYARKLISPILIS